MRLLLDIHTTLFAVLRRYDEDPDREGLDRAL